MKAIMLMFDSLNRHMLPSYGCDWIKTPNFERLAERTVQFQNSYAGSLPCIPARRELHTGRYNFLHRGWGPLEPFDDSMPQILKDNGVHSHLVTDHQHYFEDGGATYHQRYRTWEFSRGQEGDSWIGQIDAPEIPAVATEAPTKAEPMWSQDWINRAHMTREEDQPLAKTFDKGLKFVKRNAHADKWFCQIECFDPHEPFFSQQKYKDLYPHDYDGPHYDWPPYAEVTESPETVEHLRYEYAAVVSMCDEYLGKLLDLMDERDMWKDTMLIVNTDHGYLLGEHNWWAKLRMPFYQELVHTPLLIWDPRSGRRGVQCDSLVQTIDLPATILEFFGLEVPEDMQGVPLKDALAGDAPVHEAVLFGVMGGHINCTDGHYVYMLAPESDENQPLNNYTVMPMHMKNMFSVDNLKDAVMAEPFNFTKGCPVMKIPTWRFPHQQTVADEGARQFQTELFDIKDDPQQMKPFRDEAVEAMMTDHIVRLMDETDAPAEQYERMGLKATVPG